MDGASPDVRATASIDGAAIPAGPSSEAPARLRIATRRLAVHASVVIALAVLAIVHTWPLATSWRTDVAGGAFEDTWMNMWHIHWWRESFLHGKNPFFAPLLHWPLGAELYWHTHAPAKSLLGALLVPSLGIVGAYNAVVFSSFVLTGLTAFWLMRDLLARAGAHGWRADAAAFVGACVLDFSRYHLCHSLGHVNLSALEGLPLFLLFFFRAIEAPRANLRRNAIGAALAAGYVALCDFYYVYYLALFAVAWLAFRAWKTGPLLSRAWLKSDDARRALQVAIASAVACVPAILPVLLHVRPAPLEIHHGDSDYPADLTMPFVPDALSTWQRMLPAAAAHALRHMQSCISNDLEGGVFIGYAALALAAFAWKTRPAESRPLTWIAVGFAVLSLGAYLYVGGERALPVQLALALVVALAFVSPKLRAAKWGRDVKAVLAFAVVVSLVSGITAWGASAKMQVPLPYLFFKHVVPLFGRGGMPVRFLLCTQICVAILAAYGAHALLVRRRSLSLGLATVMLVTVNADTKSTAPALTHVDELPAVFDTIRDDPDPIAVYTDHVLGQWEQIKHGRPVSFARQSRLPAREKAFVDAPLDRALVHFERLGPTPSEAAQMREFLRVNHYRYLVTHEAAVREMARATGAPAADLRTLRRAFVERTLHARVVYEDAERSVFRISDS